ncbi:solute carrier family 35 member G1-like protein [Dinothrombium tinctorium]|uniref:Solute carrier family 35 member G1-like protein n=1 Tax=Dinothrombium tinctorium TaxID=1965070 RepID=A0A443REF5_9ACAR|nr:solute carrier family 35 member G1-like protein [Dinothrombium tinctorium]
MQDKKKCEEVNKRSFYEKLAKIPAIGIIFALFNSFLAPTCALIVKLVVEIHPIEHNIFRSLFQLIVYTLVILYYKYPIFGEKEERWFLLARCICGFLGSTFGFMSLRYLPLGDSAAIGLSTPIVVTIFARIFLKEPIGMAQVFALLATVVGGFLICRPTFIFGANGNSDFDETRRLTGTLLSFLAVISTAFVFITLRKLRKTSAAVVVFWLSLFYVLTGTTILTLIGSLKLPASIQSYILLFLLGLSGSLAQLCLTLATKLEKAGPISLANTAKKTVRNVGGSGVLPIMLRLRRPDPGAARGRDNI